ncbi:unnamed protein product [Paramecium sonneborni]|uniref:Transmembrane protein n=1 Tax=Paramecium sonneborni TaxID=65129 RepID=A0A8S1QAR9_9CILI|nr:unnamed protein product [Paramecium sonneborni]
MRKKSTFILPPLENQKIIAINKQVKKDISEQHNAMESVRLEINSIVSLKYQAQIKSISPTRFNRIHTSQSLHQPIINQPIKKIEVMQSSFDFLQTIKKRFLKSSIEPENIEMLKWYQQEEYYELQEYFEKNPIDQFIQGLTLLYRAVKHEHFKMIQFLLSKVLICIQFKKLFINNQFEEMALSVDESLLISKVNSQLKNQKSNAYLSNIFQNFISLNFIFQFYLSYFKFIIILLLQIKILILQLNDQRIFHLTLKLCIGNDFQFK